MARQAAGSRWLVFFGAACVLSGRVACGTYEDTPASVRVPELALYVPAGLRPVVPGPQTAPVVTPSVMTPMRSPAAVPASPVAPPSGMMPTTVDSPGAQMPIGQSPMDSTQQTLVPAVESSVKEALMGILYGFAASVAIGMAIARKRIVERLQGGAGALGAEDSLELGVVSERSGVPMMMSGGKGFGGGEATRDPEPTRVDPNDPKGKQQAIHKAESFADYLKRRNGGGQAEGSTTTVEAGPSTAAEGGKGFGGGEATRDPDPTQVDPNDPKGKQQAIHKAESFADYLKRREAEQAGGPTTTVVAGPTTTAEGGKGFGGGEATRDPEPTAIDPNDPKGKQQAIHKAESFADYLKRRETAGRAGGPTMMAPAGDAGEEEMSIAAPPGWTAVREELWPEEMQPDMRIEGGKTLKTFKMPPHAERVQYILKSPNGRPTKARVELWIGPIRSVHELIYDCMSGYEFPLRSTLQFKKLSPVLKISGDDGYEFPVECGVFVPDPEQSEKIGEMTTDMFYSAPMKDRVQGGSTIDGKGGAIRSFEIDPTWEKTQIMVSSKDVGKKSFKTNIEICQGPNNPKQFLNLRCGGSTQPYHAVIDTPGTGWTIRCNSKKYLEDGLFEIAIAPYGKVLDSAPLEPAVVMGGGGFY